MNRFAGKVCIVTGGAGQIGRAVVQRLGVEGGKVAVVDYNGKALTEVISVFQNKNLIVKGFEVDVTDRIAVKKMVEDVVNEWGRVDVLANIAGGGNNATIHEMTEQQWLDVLNLNLTGTFFCIQAVVDQMAKQGGGMIVNTSSTAKDGVIWYKQAGIGRSNYSAAKAGLIGLVRSLALELAEHNININNVIPGPIMTDESREGFEALEKDDRVTAPPSTIIPLGRYGTPEEVASAFAFLASEDASFITGESLYVSGGL